MCLRPHFLFQSWHKRCFTCAVSACARHLDSFTVNDAPDGEIYCKACYGHKFGVRGVGFGLGAGALNMVRTETVGRLIEVARFPKNRNCEPGFFEKNRLFYCI